jgi:hypothetical protein
MTPNLTPEALKAKALEIIDASMKCNCGAAYRDRGLTDPNCVRCNYGDDLAEDISAALIAIAERASAKDARIAELEGLLRHANAYVEDIDLCEKIESVLKGG